MDGRPNWRLPMKSKISADIIGGCAAFRNGTFPQYIHNVSCSILTETCYKSLWEKYLRISEIADKFAKNNASSIEFLGNWKINILFINSLNIIKSP